MGKMYYVQYEVNFSFVGTVDLNSLSSSMGTVGNVSESQAIQNRKTETASGQKFGKSTKIHHRAAQPIEDWQSGLGSARRRRSTRADRPCRGCAYWWRSRCGTLLFSASKMNQRSKILAKGEGSVSRSGRGRWRSCRHDGYCRENILF